MWDFLINVVATICVILVLILPANFVWTWLPIYTPHEGRWIRQWIDGKGKASQDTCPKTISYSKTMGLSRNGVVMARMSKKSERTTVLINYDRGRSMAATRLRRVVDHAAHNLDVDVVPLCIVP